MSRVFVARDEALGRGVVVKVLAPKLAELAVLQCRFVHGDVFGRSPALDG
jgi:hypothetical protein